MIWKAISGYRYPYRISEEGVVQRQRFDGSWRTLTPYVQGGKGNNGRYAVKMTKGHKEYEVRFLVDLMLEAFGDGKRPPGKVLTHRNGMRSDCAWCNLMWTTPREIGKRYGGGGRRSVEKIDRDGNVVDLFSSAHEAAKKEYVSRKSIYLRCTGQCKGDPFKLTGFNYRYEGKGRGRSKK